MHAIEFETLLPAFALGVLIDTPHAEQELNMQRLEAAHNLTGVGQFPEGQQALMPSHTSTGSLTRYGLPRPSAASQSSRDAQTAQPDNEANGAANGRRHGGGLPTTHTAGTDAQQTHVASSVDWEEIVHTAVLSIFMVFVGLSIPALFGENAEDD